MYSQDKITLAIGLIFLTLIFSIVSHAQEAQGIDPRVLQQTLDYINEPKATPEPDPVRCTTIQQGTDWYGNPRFVTVCR